MERPMVHAHAWVGPYDGGWHCYHCGTTVTLPTGQEPDVAGCPVTTDELLVRFRERPNGWSRRSWATLTEMLQQERDEALRWKTYWAEHYDQCCQDITTLVRERDEARAEREKGAESFVQMTRNYADIVNEIDRLRALLREVEWNGRFARCPACWQETHNGHAPDCRLHAALEGRDG